MAKPDIQKFSNESALEDSATNTPAPASGVAAPPFATDPRAGFPAPPAGLFEPLDHSSEPGPSAHAGLLPGAAGQSRVAQAFAEAGAPAFLGTGGPVSIPGGPALEPAGVPGSTGSTGPIYGDGFAPPGRPPTSPPGAVARPPLAVPVVYRGRICAWLPVGARIATPSFVPAPGSVTGAWPGSPRSTPPWPESRSPSQRIALKAQEVAQQMATDLRHSKREMAKGLLGGSVAAVGLLLLSRLFWPNLTSSDAQRARAATVPALGASLPPAEPVAGANRAAPASSASISLGLQPSEAATLEPGPAAPPALPAPAATVGVQPATVTAPPAARAGAGPGEPALNPSPATVANPVAPLVAKRPPRTPPTRAPQSAPAPVAVPPQAIADDAPVVALYTQPVIAEFATSADRTLFVESTDLSLRGQRQPRTVHAQLKIRAELVLTPTLAQASRETETLRGSGSLGASVGRHSLAEPSVDIGNELFTEAGPW